MFPHKPNTLAGFEPGSSFPQADAMSTAPRRQCFIIQKLCIFLLSQAMLENKIMNTIIR
jgi:hypothetical protein